MILTDSGKEQEGSPELSETEALSLAAGLFC